MICAFAAKNLLRSSASNPLMTESTTIIAATPIAIPATDRIAIQEKKRLPRFAFKYLKATNDENDNEDSPIVSS